MKDDYEDEAVFSAWIDQPGTMSRATAFLTSAIALLSIGYQVGLWVAQDRAHRASDARQAAEAHWQAEKDY